MIRGYPAFNTSKSAPGCFFVGVGLPHGPSSDPTAPPFPPLSTEYEGEGEGEGEGEDEGEDEGEGEGEGEDEDEDKYEYESAHGSTAGSAGFWPEGAPLAPSAGAPPAFRSRRGEERVALWSVGKRPSGSSWDQRKRPILIASP